MSFEYIANQYQVPAELGREVTYMGNLGVIMGCRGAHLIIQLDKDTAGVTGLYHPTWELVYGEMRSLVKLTAPSSERASFANMAGVTEGLDAKLTEELRLAGIPTLEDSAGPMTPFVANLLSEQAGEVKSAVRGSLYGWEFKRAWKYWMCSGPGIEAKAAERLHDEHGHFVRVDGDAGCPSPLERYKGLAIGNYHVDDAEGLRALANTIRELVMEAEAA